VTDWIFIMKACADLSFYIDMFENVYCLVLSKQDPCCTLQVCALFRQFQVSITQNFQIQ
jgi:hypothetical protein